VPFREFPIEIRKLIYTTDEIVNPIRGLVLVGCRCHRLEDMPALAILANRA
jgi:hypothetical protein